MKKLRLGVLGYGSRKVNIRKTDLEKLVRETLSFPPLREFIRVDIVKAYKRFADSYRFQKDYDCMKDAIDEIRIRMLENLEIVVVVSELDHINMYDGRTIYCENNSIILAHELGHVLGLKHPKECLECGRKEEKEALEKASKCEYSKYLMGCAYTPMGFYTSREGFSPQDIENLNKRKIEIIINLSKYNNY